MFVSLSQKSSSAGAVGVEEANRRARDASRVRRDRRRRRSAPASARRRPTPRCCGTTASGGRGASASSGPRLCAVTSMRRSCGPAFAYSTTTSKYRSSSKAPVSSSSYSNSWRPRSRFVATRSSYGNARLRVLVEQLRVRVRRRVVDVEPVLLDVLAVIALAVGQPEHPLLEDRVRAVPQRECEAEALAVVGHAGDPVLAPAVGARARVVVGEVVPGVAALAAVLAHGAPLALGEVRAPFLPRRGAAAGLLEARVLRCHRFEILGPAPAGRQRRRHPRGGGAVTRSVGARPIARERENVSALIAA